MATMNIAATRVATGLSQPLYVTAAPGDTSRLFIVEKTGTIKILDLNTGTVLATPFLTVPVNTVSERGLLGLAFDPGYATNGAFYVYATSNAASPRNEVWRYHVSSSNPNVAGPGRDLILDVGPSTNGNHNAGWLGFGPDGYLYIASGEVGVPANAQTTSNLLGKILRIDVDPVAFGYQIPADNPFVGAGGGARGEIFALGLRNPWRASFDSLTGAFFIGDVGGNAFEEVNLGQRGANYGWPNAEGTSANPAFTNPIHTYPHGATASITGGYVYRGESDALNGQYFFADFAQNRLFTLRLDGLSWVATERTSQIVPNVGTVDAPASFGEDANGNLYVVDITGEIFRLTAILRNDFNGDSRSDILWRHDNGTTAIWHMDGATVVSNPIIANPAQTPPDWHVEDSADFNADGRADILWRHDNGTTAIWHMDGATVLSNPIIASSAQAPPDWHVAGTGDFNADGRADILWRHDNGTTAIWLMNGATVLSNPIIASSAQAPPDWHVAGIGDFNADGKDDIVWRNDNGTTAIWLMDGTAATAKTIIASSAQTPPDWNVAGIGDFNGDSRADILWRNDNGTTAIWLMDGAAATTKTIIANSAQAPPDWHVADVHDFTGDGKDDILWRNDNGTVGLWQMDGTTVVANPIIASSAQAPPDWQVAVHHFDLV